MKKTTALKTLAAAALTILAAGCAKEQLADNGGQAGVSFTVEVPGAPATRAIGDGTTAKTLYYQVFDEQGNTISGLGAQTTTFGTDGKVKVSFQLVKDQTYNFIFWAQTSEAGYYTVGGTEAEKDLRTITANYDGKKSNDENFDAFFAVEKALKISGPVTKDITLKRPFAQINIGTKGTISAGTATRPIEFNGATSTVKVTGVPTVFSPLANADAQLGTTADVTFEAALAPEGSIKVNEETYKLLAMNYVFASETGDVTDITATLTVENKNVPLIVPNAPIRRNWRTNIVGNLLTAEAGFNVILDPNFSGDDNQHPIFVNGVAYKTLDAAVAAVPAGEQTIIKLEQDIVGNGIKTTDGQDIVIDLGGHTFDIDGTMVGSTGSETNGHQFLKGSKVTLKNGTIKSTKAYILIQNYCDLTLEDVTLDASESVGAKEGSYVISNNHGTVKILGSTSILAPAGKVAFDVYYWPPYYKDGVNVYVNTTGTIRGAIEYGCESGSETASETLSSLVIDNAVLENSSFKTSLANPNVKIACGLFSDEAAVNAWIPTGYNAVKTGGYYIVTSKTVNVVDSQEDLAVAVSTSDAMIKLEAGSYTLPSATGDGVTFVGPADGSVVIDVPSAVALHDKNVKFNGVTVKSPNGNYTGIQHAASVKYENCVIEGQPFSYAATAVYDGCTFEQTSSDAYNIWTYGTANITFNNCKFNCAGKSVLIYNEGALAAGTVTFNDCEFKASESVAGKAAIEIDSSYTSYEIYVNNCTQTGFSNGSVSGNPLWNKKQGDKSVKIYVDGSQVL